MDGTMVRVACCFGDEGKFAYSGEVLFNHVQPQAAETIRAEMVTFGKHLNPFTAVGAIVTPVEFYPLKCSFGTVEHPFGA